MADVLAALVFAHIPNRALLHELDHLLSLLALLGLLFDAEPVLVLQDLLPIIDLLASLIHQISRLVH